MSAAELLTYTVSDGKQNYFYHFVGKSFYEAVQICASKYNGSLLYNKPNVINFVVKNLPTSAQFNFWINYVQTQRRGKFMPLQPPNTLPSNSFCTALGLYTYNKQNPQKWSNKCSYISSFICQNNSSPMEMGMETEETTPLPEEMYLDATQHPWSFNHLGITLAAATGILLLMLLILLLILCSKSNEAKQSKKFRHSSKTSGTTITTSRLDSQDSTGLPRFPFAISNTSMVEDNSQAAPPSDGYYCSIIDYENVNMSGANAVIYDDVEPEPVTDKRRPCRLNFLHLNR